MTEHEMNYKDGIYVYKVNGKMLLDHAMARC